MTNAVPSNPLCIAVVVYWTCSCLLLLGIFLLCLPLFCSVRSLHVNTSNVKEVGVWVFFLQCIEEVVLVFLQPKIILELSLLGKILRAPFDLHFCWPS